MLKILPLGGLGEIGLNMMVISYDDYILVIDAGLMFPEDYMHGIDFVIPDTQYLRENKEKVKAIILTHGHEDHIGAMPFFLRDFNIPVYGTPFTLDLLEEKLKEHSLPADPELHRIRPGDINRFGPFEIEFIKVNHSIIDGVGLAIKSPEGVIIHSGDFKIDQTPQDGNDTNLNSFSRYGNNGVLALLSDSTNAEKEGFTLSEIQVINTLEALFQSCSGRLIIAVFASNIKRIQQITQLAAKFGRKVLFSGKSMITNVKIAREGKFIDIPPDIEISESEVNRLQDDELVVITTGSQGEPMSALSRMARNKHKTLKIKEGDTIILSSRFIPGNEKAITYIINNLYRMGAEVVYEKVSQIHSSGHAYKEELKLLLNSVKPRFFIPIHGEYRHLVKHANLASETGIPDNNILIVENGTPVCFNNGAALIENSISTGRTLVDGKGGGDAGEIVLRDRRRLAGDGVVIFLMTVDERNGDILNGPEFLSHGFIFEEEGESILDQAGAVVLELLSEMENSPPVDWTIIGQDIKRRLNRFFNKVIERRPLIVPIIIPV